jgi:hypothetical protein
MSLTTTQYDSEWKEGHVGNFEECMVFMEQLCENKILHSYGFTLDLEPFNQHTPPVGGYYNQHTTSTINTTILIHTTSLYKVHFSLSI